MRVRILRFEFGCEEAPHAYSIPGGFGVCFGRVQFRFLWRRSHA